MKIRKITFLKNILLFFTIWVISYPVSSAWVDIQIIDIRAYTKQVSHYVIANNFSNPDQCTYSNSLIVMRDDIDNWKMVHAYLLTGMLASKPMQVRTAGCTAGGNPIIDAVMIRK